MKRIAILTGATGGLGQAFLRELLREDIDEIWAVARNQKKLEEICSNFGNKVFPVLCDLSDEIEVKKLAALLEERRPNVRFLINNAGMARMGRIEAFSSDEISSTIEINCKAPTLICQYALPYMREGARILNISSASSFQPNPYIALYSATKAYLRSYSRSLNYEWREKGITCTAVCPGWIDTQMLKKEHAGRRMRFPGMVSPERVAVKALKDAKKGKDMSVCSLFVKYEHLWSKFMPQKWTMHIWGSAVKRYVDDQNSLPAK